MKYLSKKNAQTPISTDSFNKLTARYIELSTRLRLIYSHFQTSHHRDLLMYDPNDNHQIYLIRIYQIDFYTAIHLSLYGFV